MHRSGGDAAIRADRKEVFPEPGGPETITEADTLMARSRKTAAAGVSDPSSTNESRVWRRRAYRRMVAESRSPTGGITAVRRAVPSKTRAWAIGLEASRRRSVLAINCSKVCRFSDSVVGTSAACKVPPASRYVTWSPSMNISSMSDRSRRLQSGPRPVTDLISRSTVALGSASERPSPRCARL